MNIKEYFKKNESKLTKKEWKEIEEIGKLTKLELAGRYFSAIGSHTQEVYLDLKPNGKVEKGAVPFFPFG